MRRFLRWISKPILSQSYSVARRRIDLGNQLQGAPIYAIGDVHGCLPELKSLEAAIAKDMHLSGRKGLVVLLGDYVNRGPASCQVIDYLIAPSEFGLTRLPLCGNHDDAFSRIIDAQFRGKTSFAMGADKTLLSYGLDMAYLQDLNKKDPDRTKDLLSDAIPLSHRDFLARLPISVKIGDILFVHAGIKPGVALEEQRDVDMLQIREPFLSRGPELESLLVIHGHTPNQIPTIGPNRIGVDTGAFFTGKLTAIKIDGMNSAYLSSR